MKKFNPSPTLITRQFQDLHLIWIWIITLKIFFHLNNPSFIHLEWCSISPNQNGDRQMQENERNTKNDRRYFLFKSCFIQNAFNKYSLRIWTNLLTLKKTKTEYILAITIQKQQQKQLRDY